MNPKQRLLKAIQQEAVDRPPVICPGGMMNPVVAELTERYDSPWPQAHYDAAEMARLARAIVTEGLFENYGVPFCMTVEAEAMGAKVDPGHTFAEPHVIGYAVDSLGELDKLKTIDLNSGRAKVVLDAVKLLRNETVPVVGNVPGPFSIATSVVEPTHFYVQLRRSPEKCHALLEFIAREAGRFAAAQAEVGADIITIADPSGTAEILGPEYFKEYMIPYVNRMIAIIKAERDVPVILHICGKMQKVFHLLPEIKADVFSFDAIVSLDEAQRQLSVPVMGNISTYAIEHGTPDRLRRLAAKRKQYGTPIIAPACGLGLASPLTNIRSLLKGVVDDELSATNPDSGTATSGDNSNDVAEIFTAKTCAAAAGASGKNPGGDNPGGTAKTATTTAQSGEESRHA